MSGVFDGGTPPPPPPGPSTGRSAVGGAALPDTPLGRFAFFALIPSLLLPALVTGGAVIGAMGPGRSGDGYNIGWLVIGAFCLVLIGSMALNTWLLLRHSETWRLKALPTGIAVMLVVLWGLLVVGAIVAATVALNEVALVLGFAVIITSIVVFIAALVRRSVKTAVAPVVAVGLSRYGAALGWSYLALVAVTLVAAALQYVSVGAVALLTLLVPVGLPWSWPLAAIGLMLFAWGGPVVNIVAVVLIVAGIVVNVVVVVRLLTNAAFRVRFVNWFFRLGAGGRKGDANDPTSIRTFAAPLQ